MNPNDPKPAVPDVHPRPAETTTSPDVEAHAPGDRPDRRRLLLLGAGVLVIVALLGWLFSGSGTQTRPPLAGLPWVDGTLTIVEPGRLQMISFEPVDGEVVINFTILERDRSWFDIAHIRAHSSLAIPTRIHYERDGDTFVALYKSDAPPNLSRR